MVPDRKPRSHRGILFAAGIALAIGSMLWGLYPEEPYLSGEAGYQEKDPAYHPGGRNCQPYALSRLTWLEALERSDACRESAEQYRLAANDLIQQRRSAYAAEAAAISAYSQAWVSLWGAIFSFLTLCAAIAAALYAKKAADAASDAVGHAESAANAGWTAVDQAKAATIAAQDAVGATREIGEAQVRAYLYLTADAPAGIEMPDHFECAITITNAGQSPARGVICRSIIVIRSSSFEGNECFESMKGYRDTLPIDGEALGDIAASASAQSVARLRSEKRNLLTETDYFIVCIVTYFDVFRKELRATRYCARLDGDRGKSMSAPHPSDYVNKWTLTRFHNEAT